MKKKIVAKRSKNLHFTYKICRHDKKLAPTRPNLLFAAKKKKKQSKHVCLLKCLRADKFVCALVYI